MGNRGQEIEGSRQFLARLSTHRNAVNEVTVAVIRTVIRSLGCAVRTAGKRKCAVRALTHRKHRYVVLVAMSATLIACDQRTGARESGSLQTYHIGAPGQEQIEINIDPINKGLGSELPWRIGIAFTTQQLRAFFQPGQIPLSSATLKILEDDEADMRALQGCGGYIGDSPVSMVINPSKDHAILSLMKSQDTEALFEYRNNPRQVFGLVNLGGIKYPGQRDYSVSDDLRIGERVPFGFIMTCGHLRNPNEGGCVVQRDVNAKVSVQYSFCEHLLPHWRELDDLYFEIADRVINNPLLSSNYRLGTSN